MTAVPASLLANWGDSQTAYLNVLLYSPYNCHPSSPIPKQGSLRIKQRKELISCAPAGPEVPPLHFTHFSTTLKFKLALDLKK